MPALHHRQMARGLVLGALAGMALATTSGSSQRPRVPPRAGLHVEPQVEPHIEPQVEEEGRRPEPGVHRAGPAELAVRNRVAQAESAKLLARARLRAQAQLLAPSVPATTWVSLGPTGAIDEFNGFDIPGVDSGRLNTIVVDPRDPNVVYVASSGGGVWKTFNFLAASGPSWTPLGDMLPNLAIGALALDPASPDTLYLGNGDFVDGSGNTVLKSVDGGGTRGPLVVLAGPYPPPNNFPARVRAVRALGVRGAPVRAGADGGLAAAPNGAAG